MTTSHTAQRMLLLRHRQLELGRVKLHEADRSLIILDANEIIFKPTFDRFLQYFKTLETLAIRSDKNGIDVVIHMGAFRHYGIEQELLEYERTFNITCRSSKSSFLFHLF